MPDDINHQPRVPAQPRATQTEPGETKLGQTGRGQTGRGLTFANFRPISRNGFGDAANSYCHGMEYFDGNLYVGTTRNSMALLKLFPPIDPPALDPWPVNVPATVEDLDMQGHVWRWSPKTEQWKQVLRSPLIIGKNGKEVPRDLGYRGMTVFQGRSDPVPALYVASMSTVLRGTAAHILRSYDGENFAVVGEPGLGNPRISTFRSLNVFDGHLYAPPAGEGVTFNSNRASIIMRSADPDVGKWEQACERGFGDHTNNGIFDTAVFNDHLYAGTFNHYHGYQVWKTKANGGGPCKWTKVLERGAYRGQLSQIAMALCPFNGALYIGSSIQNGGYDRYNLVGPASGEIVRVYPDDSWELLVGTPRETPAGRKYPLSGLGPGFDSIFAGYIWRMVVHDGWLYVTTFDWSLYLHWAHRASPTAQKLVRHFGVDRMVEIGGGFEIYRTKDGVNWIPVSRNGMGNPYNYGGRTLVSAPEGMFIGTANPFGPEAPAKLASRNVYIPNPDGGTEVWFGNADYQFIEDTRERGGEFVMSGRPTLRIISREETNLIAVTGGAGFLGSNLVRRLLGAGHRVNVLAIPGTADKLPRCPELRVIEGDLDDRAALAELIEGAHILVHLAARLGGSCSTADLRHTNIDGAHNLYRVVERGHSLKRLVFVSSSAVYSGQYKPKEWPLSENAAQVRDGGGALADYGLSKVAGENLTRWYARKCKIEYSMVRPSLVYGFGDTGTGRLIQAAFQDPTFGEGPRSKFPHQYVHVDDAVEAIMRVAFMAAAANEVFNVAGADVVSHGDMVRMLRRLQGNPLPGDLLPDRTRLWRRYEMTYDTGKIRRRLDFIPAVPMEDGLARVIEAMATEAGAAAVLAPQGAGTVLAPQGAGAVLAPQGAGG
jgi:nucleoside-diphosphate-sugar epimerase